MNIYRHLKVVGGLLVALGLAHGVFSRYFKWKEELAQLSLLTRQILLVHCFFIALLLVMMGVWSLFYPSALLGSGSLSRVVLTGFVVLVVPLSIPVLRIRSSHLAGTAALHGHARGSLALLDLRCADLRRCITDDLEGMIESESICNRTDLMLT